MVLLAVLEERLVVVDVCDKDDYHGGAGVDGPATAVTARTVISGGDVHLTEGGGQVRSGEVTLQMSDVMCQRLRCCVLDGCQMRGRIKGSMVTEIQCVRI